MPAPSRPVPELPIPVAGPWITEREVEAVADAARNAWYRDSNLEIKGFEEDFAKYCRAPRTRWPCRRARRGSTSRSRASGSDPGTRSSCRTRRGSPPPHRSATSARPRSSSTSTPSTGASRPTRSRLRSPSGPRGHRGRPLRRHARHGPLVSKCATGAGSRSIEDAAEAAGSTFGGRRAGGFGVASAFSFHGSKTLTTHEGGMVLTDDSELHARMITLRDHGQAPVRRGPVLERSRLPTSTR